MSFSKNIKIALLLIVSAFTANTFVGCAQGWHKNKKGICVKNGTLDRVSILNEYPGDISVQLVWRNKNELHNRFNTNEIVKRGRHNTFRAPFLGYELEKIIVTPTAIAAGIGAAAAAGAVASGVAVGALIDPVVTTAAAGIVAFDGTIRANKNRYFVVSRSNNKVKGTSTPKVVITGYKNQAEYKAGKNQIVVPAA